jgi:hypothetical protein
MSDYTLAFEELPLLTIGTLTAGGVDGAADIDLGVSSTSWKIQTIRLNVWNARTRKATFVTLTDEDPSFMQIANALVIHPVYGEMIERAVKERHSSPSAYDRARDLREAA